MNRITSLTHALFQVDALLLAVIATVLLGGVIVFAVVGAIFWRPAQPAQKAPVKPSPKPVKVP